MAVSALVLSVMPVAAAGHDVHIVDMFPMVLLFLCRSSVGRARRLGPPSLSPL